MKVGLRLKRGWFRTFVFGVALATYFDGLTASAKQPLEVPAPPPDNAAPATVELPPTTNTELTFPIKRDPISRVPSFFGDFVARPSVALVNQPRIVSTSTSTIVSTRTLSFFGLPNDVAGGLGSNIFYAPFRPNGIAGPGGPYRIFTDVTGTGVPPFPITSILNENAELTARIQAQHPGAIFAGGIGLLDPPFAVTFDYLQTTTQPVTTIQTVPGLVALLNLPNPSGGGMIGRNKYFDDGSPVPRDRVFFDYNHVGEFKGLGTQYDVNRYVFGAEKTFLDGFGSVEIRVPFAGTVNSDQNGGQPLDVNNAEFGNVGLLIKGTLFRNANWIVTAGMGVSVPTADDSRILFAGTPVLEIRNNAWLLQPILGAAWAPNDRFYVQTGLQFDFDANGNPLYVRNPGGEFGRRSVLTDQTYLYASGAVGYWLYQSDTNFLSGVSLQGELHYNRTLGKRDVVQTGSVLVTDLGSDIDVLNATAGVNVLLRDRATLGLGVSLPVTSDRLYDWSLMARINVPFGKVSR